MSIKRKVIDSIENGSAEKKKLKGSKIKLEKDSATHKVPASNNSERHSNKSIKTEKQKEIHKKAEHQGFTKGTVNKIQDPKKRFVDSQKPVLENDKSIIF